MTDRFNQLIKINERVDREAARIQALYDRQMVFALRELQQIILVLKAASESSDDPNFSAVLTEKVAKLAEVVFARYGVNSAGVFAADISSFWSEIQTSGALAPLPVKNSRGCAPTQTAICLRQQHAIELQRDLVMKAKNASMAFTTANSETIERSTILGAQTEMRLNPTRDPNDILVERLERRIRALVRPAQGAPRFQFRNLSKSLG